MADCYCVFSFQGDILFTELLTKQVSSQSIIPRNQSSFNTTTSSFLCLVNTSVIRVFLPNMKKTEGHENYLQTKRRRKTANLQIGPYCYFVPYCSFKIERCCISCGWQLLAELSIPPCFATFHRFQTTFCCCSYCC